ncbi:hypothetical protein TBLA_0A07700 [Henningerozyma blattae CBS 6284]|uniref:Serine aminopeptidase S33 domain-containing protein n=1 Tax=Henningerozyma blattae (strain ATCC 34711 / CBS 6284 / DSM 70876 / NBRC 10599 / NRRL Y-10934 / UCD 77-7) TaxID=1071380 RepID=I2GWQ7_HENB6|nr:hypothetical protein TBLA_0A07700 [Tetrapisispora blattae CBS 6284]CCH58559.1 hypothetical protein TBLA_0A07700 [Tetrapisispora blattae CBS 6284]
MPRKTVSMLAGAIGVTSLIVSMLYVFQNKLVYPSWAEGARNHVATPDSYDIPYKRVILKTKDNVDIEAYDMRNENRDSISTVLILCPNAGNIGYFLPIADIFYKRFGMSVFLYSYRGYGHSEGSPSETGLKLDADRVISYLSTDSFHKQKKIVLFGRSLGGANAIYIASKYPQLIDGVILENTFLSIRKVIPYMIPILKYVANWCHEIWNSELSITKTGSFTPFLFMGGQKDEIVPPSHMKRLYELCPSTQKQIFEFPLGYHNDTIVQEGYWEIVKSFLEGFKFI